jgi:hypothetical protein
LISNFSLILAAMRYQLIWRTAQVHNRPKSLSALPCRSPPERRRRPPSPSLAALSHPLPLRPPLLPVAVEAPIPSKDGAGEGLHGSVAREAMGCMLGTSGGMATVAASWCTPSIGGEEWVARGNRPPTMFRRWRLDLCQI